MPFSIRVVVALPLFLSGLLGSCQTVSEKSVPKAEKTAAFTAPKAGHYLGYLKTAGLSTKIPVSFELLPLNNNGSEIVYRGHFKISNGTHISHEYASYNFNDTSYDPKTNSFNFLTLNGMTSLALRFQSAGSGNGTIRISTGQTAEITLEHEDETNSDKIRQNIYPELSANAVLSGTYRGQCLKAGGTQRPEEAVLEVEAVKTRGHSPDDAGELKGYQISARLGKTDADTCKGTAPCFRQFYTSGTYNLLSGALKLTDDRASIECRMAGSTLTCGTCQLTQVPDSAYGVLGQVDTEKAKAASIVRNKSQKFDSTHGQFYGYVHNARQNTYQLIAVNVFEDDSEQATPSPETSPVNGVVTLYFGDGDTNEYIAYRMKPALMDHKDQRFFWDSEGEIILKVLTWKSDVMVGDWISKAYGRVGHFMVQKGQMPQMSKAVSTVPKISGVYSSDEWEFEIAAYSELSENSQEIYPLNSYGWAKEKAPHARRRIIKKIHFDFYTGTIAFDLDDGRTIAGRVGANRMDMLWWPRVNYGAPFSPIKVVKFEKISDNPTPQAKIFLDRLDR